MAIAAGVETASEPLWRPSPERLANSQLEAFRAGANTRHGLDLKDFPELHAWSVTQTADFWELVWDFCGIVGEALANPHALDLYRDLPDLRT